MSAVIEKSSTDSKPNPSQHLPFRTLELLLFLQKFPSGLASTELAVGLRGITPVSARSQEISRARLEATRKLIQRTRHFLAQTNSQWRLEYCRTNRVWKAIRFTPSFNKPISQELNWANLTH